MEKLTKKELSQMLTNAIFGTCHYIIKAFWKNGRSDIYSGDILEDLEQNEDIKKIIENNTGVLIFSRKDLKNEK